ADVALPILAERWEKRSWEKERLSEGWLRVDREKLAAKKLDRWKPEKKTLGSGRSLFLLHGTFSNAGSAFHELAKGDFFDRSTPLATPERWERTVGWIANLLEMFPDNPFTTGASWIGEAIVWLARHASGNLPGINSMNAAGDLISELQAPPAPPADAYSVLAAN